MGTFLFNNNAVAQSVGAGMAYGTEIEAIGTQANGVYGFTDEIRGVPILNSSFQINHLVGITLSGPSMLMHITFLWRKEQHMFMD